MAEVPVMRPLQHKASFLAPGRRVLGGAIVMLLTLMGSPLTLAAPAAPAAAEVSRLQAECARLRSELTQVNAEIASLKRGDRGVRDDYRLRQRMADAEALARKLTEAESRLRARTGAPAPAPAPALAPPSAQPGDGPVELEAKADLLSDQARRLAAEADGLARTAGQLRGRQTLRKRAFQLERDPFAGVDGSKRIMMFGAPRAGSRTGGGESNTDTKAGGGGANDTSRGASPGTGGSSGSGGASGSGSATPVSGTSPPPPSTSQPAPTAPPPSGESLRPPTVPPQPTSALSTQLRTLLDPLTLAEVQRFERTGKPITDPEALEKLAAALRQRAQALSTQAKALRSQAHP
jgi:hypothetical protein